ncbi:hypothetical protein [Parvibaculum sp.]|jgi:hypothetical protein|uniref:hypothetical protein n=1 Tax=Parvibaculum sp. TaxID=2024848 RepID=UPI002FDABE1A
MPDRDWWKDPVIAVAAASIFMLVAAYAVGVVLWQYTKIHEVYSTYQHNADEDRRDAAEKAAQACKDREVATLSSCIADEIEAHWRQQATNQDLQAQQDMANWALWMFITSSVTVFVTAIGVYFVWRTLEETRAAVSVATDGNKAAQLAAELTLKSVEIAEHAERAWVFAGASMQYNPSDSGPVYAVSVLVRGANCGKTPGIVGNLCVVISDTAPEGDVAVYDGAFITHVDSVLASGADNILYEFVTAPEAKFCYGYIEYRDVLRKPHTSRFCVAFIRNRGKTIAVSCGPPAYNDWD